MRMALCSIPSRRSDVSWNLSRMEEMASAAKNQKSEMILFGEAFLQGKDSFRFDYKEDVALSLALRSDAIVRARRISEQLGIATGFGFYENWKGGLYSSYLVIEGLRTLVHQRACSSRWKEGACADYREAKAIEVAEEKGQRFAVLIGDDFMDDDCIVSISEKDPEVDFFIWCVGSLELKKRALLRSQILEKPIALIQRDRLMLIKQGVILQETQEELLYIDR